MRVWFKFPNFLKKSNGRIPPNFTYHFLEFRTAGGSQHMELWFGSVLMIFSGPINLGGIFCRWTFRSDDRNNLRHVWHHGSCHVGLWILRWDSWEVILIVMGGFSDNDAKNSKRNQKLDLRFLLFQRLFWFVFLVVFDNKEVCNFFATWIVGDHV